MPYYRGKAEFLNDAAHLDWRPQRISFGIHTEHGRLSTKYGTPENNYEVEWYFTYAQINEYDEFNIVADPVVGYDLEIRSESGGRGDNAWVEATLTCDFTADFDYRANVVFEDWDIADGRPTELEVQLFGNGAFVQSAIVNDANDWTCTFPSLLKEGTWRVYLVVPPNVEIWYQTKTWHDAVQTTFTLRRYKDPQYRPEPGEHPTTEDLDLKYSHLYDDISVENAFEVIHVLDYGDYKQPPYDFPRP